MSVYISEETQVDFKFDYSALINKVTTACLDFVECPYEAEINVSLTDNKNIKIINNEFRGIDKSTDVLSFPMIEYETPGKFDFPQQDQFDNFDPDSGELLLGDIVVSVEKTISQAEEYNHSVERELAFLIAHSMLHLVGYDHEIEADMIVMEKMQEEILNILGISR